MKMVYKIIFAVFLFSTLVFGAEKKVLVEIFTNSHCPLCPSAHSTLDSYLQSPNGDKINFIYYHMTFPYPDDQLYLHNDSDADAKNSFYGPHSSTPKAYFDGVIVPNSYSNWESNLDNMVNEESNFELELSASISDGSILINANVTQTGEILDNTVTSINFVAVENITYPGRNGISDHKNVMREILNPEGDPFEISLNETKNLSAVININEVWEIENIKIVVFVQDMNTKEVFQSASISSSEFDVTDIRNTENIISNFSLSQNYPNPFNPTTVINYTLPTSVSKNVVNGLNVKLKVYDILGKEIAVLVNKFQKPGDYSVEFNAGDLTSGFYYYQLKAGNFTKTRKMILIK